MTDGPSQLTDSVTRQLQALLEGAPSEARLAGAYRLLAKWRAHLIENTLARRHGNLVLSGPFEGMQYGVRASEGARAARMLGCYEVTLVPVIEQIIARGYPQVVDIGSAEGCYAVGLARRMADSRVLARDTNPEARKRCQALAEMNGVADRVETGGAFTHADFAICAGTETVIICDIEGGEDDLLDPEKAPELAQADILVEAHDSMIPGLSDRLAARFEATHKVTRLNRDVAMGVLPDWMEGLSDLDRLTALWEWRGGPTPWLWLERRQADG